jgi:hypothetical protein
VAGAADRVGEFAHEPDQLRDISFIPRRENRAADAFASPVHSVRHGLALRRYDGFPDSTIGGPGLATNEAEVFQLRDLAADGGVVAPNAACEIDDPDRAAALNEDEQRKQGAIERHAGLSNHHGVALRAVDDADDVDQSLVQSPDLFTHMCILHAFP